MTDKTSRQQVPWKQSSLTNDFFFRPKEALPGMIDPKELARIEEEKKQLELEKARLDEQRRVEEERMERQRRLADAEERRLRAERDRQRQEEQSRQKRRTVNIPVTP